MISLTKELAEKAEKTEGNNRSAVHSSSSGAMWISRSTGDKDSLTTAECYTAQTPIVARASAAKTNGALTGHQQTTLHYNRKYSAVPPSSTGNPVPNIKSGLPLTGLYSTSTTRLSSASRLQSAYPSSEFHLTDDLTGGLNSFGAMEDSLELINYREQQNNEGLRNPPEFRNGNPAGELYRSAEMQRAAVPSAAEQFISIPGLQFPAEIHKSAAELSVKLPLGPASLASQPRYGGRSGQEELPSALGRRWEETGSPTDSLIERMVAGLGSPARQSDPAPARQSGPGPVSRQLEPGLAAWQPGLETGLGRERANSCHDLRDDTTGGAAVRARVRHTTLPYGVAATDLRQARTAVDKQDLNMKLILKELEDTGYFSQSQASSFSQNPFTNIYEYYFLTIDI